MRKKLLIAVSAIILLVLCIIGVLWITQSYASSVVTAKLIIDSGTVQVKHAGGTWTSASNGMVLTQSDAVRTGDNTSASVVLFESSILRLDSNTEVMLQEILQQAGKTSVAVQQDCGSTWSTISKISGIDDYDVQTPTTVASVRGTSFYVHVQANGTTTVGVGTGIVNVSSMKNGQIVHAIAVNKDEEVTIDPEAIDQLIEIKPFVKNDWVLQNQQKDETLRENVKEDLVARLDPYIPELKKQYGVTDQELDVLIDGYIKGYFDLPFDTPGWIRDIIELS